MRSMIGILLIVGGIVLGYFGYNKLDNSRADVKIGDLEISASNKDNSAVAWAMIGGAAVALLAGGLMLGRKSA